MQSSQTEIKKIIKALSGRLEVPAKALPEQLQCAAVAAILQPGAAGLEVLFIRRAEKEGDPWSGHMAFPGGHHETQDSNLIHTAMRETKEEIGLDLGANGRLLGPLGVTEPRLRAGRMMAVSSFVFALTEAPVLHLNHEVAEVVVASLDDLLAGTLNAEVDKVFDGQTQTFQALNVKGHLVWGMTYSMVQKLLHIIRPLWVG